MPPRRRSDLCLLVEGKDDLFAVAHLIEERFKEGRCAVDVETNTPGKVHLIQHDGVENLLKVGVIESATKTYARLGIVVDADQPPKDRWRAVRERLAAVDVTLPSAPCVGGTRVEGHRPGWRVGVWVMPDNVSGGALEEFLTPLLSSDDALWPVATSATQQAIAAERRFGANDELKARLRCWLAWQKDPGAGVGPAISKRVIDPLHPSADAFVAWFEALFA